MYGKTYKLEGDGVLDEMKRLTEQEMKKINVQQPFVAEAQERLRVKKLELENLRHKAYTGSIGLEKSDSSTMDKKTAEDSLINK